MSRSSPSWSTPAADAAEQEILLPGGIANRGKVVRIGDTVHRPQRATSPATHALLRHLAEVGFDGAPRFLGVDARDREVLSFIPGTTVIAPYPDWALTDETLVSVARLLRAYHDAVAGFDPSPYTWPDTPPGPFVGELVSHNDPNLDNVVFRDGRAVALIDFDLASPGCGLWDVACAARLWVPLRPAEKIHDSRRDDVFRRLRVFADGYGLDDPGRSGVLRAVQQNQEWFAWLIGRQIAAGHTAFVRYKKAETRMPPEEYSHWLSGIDEPVRAALGV